MSQYYIGLMSGTSVDAIDAVLMDFSISDTHIVEAHSQEIPAELKSKINTAIVNNTWPQDVSEIDQEFAHISIESVKSLLTAASISSNQIVAIGSHGQTVWHQPSDNPPCSIQIGNAQKIANNTKIKTVANFRQADIEAGGQGAPLACAYHAEVLRNTDEDRIVLNLGGIANVTFLPADYSKKIIGFDTGPANTLLDAWINKHKGLNFDENGEWAKSGKVNDALLSIMLKDQYFQQRPPKSTGREKFNLVWLQSMLEEFKNFIVEEDVQATLAALTTKSISNALHKWKIDAPRVLLCGGGSKNSYVVSLLQSELKNKLIEQTSSHGVPEGWMEAMTFAWLAKQNLNNKFGNIPSVTGARGHVVLGESFNPK